MSYIIVVLRVCWCSVIVLNVHATCKSNNVKDSLYEELGCIFDQFPRYDVKILLSDLNVKVGSEDVFKLTVGSEVHVKLIMVMELGVVNYGTSKNLVIKTTIFPHDIHKYTCTSAQFVVFNIRVSTVPRSSSVFQ
jgi:hypothetical protein